MHTTDLPDESLSEAATPRAPGASAGLPMEATEDEPKALASALRPVPPSSNAGSADEVSPFASLKRTVLPFADRQGASMEPYSVRLPTDLKQRVTEAVARSGGRAADLFESLLDAHEKARETEAGIPEKFARVRRDVESHLRSLVTGLTANLRDLAADDETQEAEAADLAMALHDAKHRAALLRETLESKERGFEKERSAWQAEREAAAAARAQLEEERAEQRASLKALNQSLADARAQAEATSGLREKIARAEQKLAEAEQRTGRADFQREEAELKAARVTEDLVRMRRSLDENEALRIRQHQTAEEERKAL